MRIYNFFLHIFAVKLLISCSEKKLPSRSQFAKKAHLKNLIIFFVLKSFNTKLFKLLLVIKVRKTFL